MEIKASIGKFVVYASDYCKLDSNVNTGGGTDETQILQNILDMADRWGSLHLIMDGAALVRGLKIHSNTTIECLNSTCGFFLDNYADDAILKNSDLSTGEIKNKNITLKGGSYNQNCLNQNMNLPEEKHFPKGERCNSVITVFKFYGVENFTMDGVTIIDQKRYAFIMGNWKNVDIKNVNIPLPNIVHGTNQDGLHFHGPGEHLRITNCSGITGDDFIALNTDEGDGVSSISDVVIDGVYLENSDQAIRILSYNKGCISNVTIRNVTGKIRSFGFLIQPFFQGEGGKFENITFENISLEQTDHIYGHMNPKIFHLSGNIENITLKNISAKFNDKDCVVIDVSHSYDGDDREKEDKYTYIKYINIDGLYISDKNNEHSESEYIKIRRNAESITINNVIIERLDSMKKSGSVVSIEKGVNVKSFSLNGVQCENIFSDVNRK